MSYGRIRQRPRKKQPIALYAVGGIGFVVVLVVTVLVVVNQQGQPANPQNKTISTTPKTIPANASKPDRDREAYDKDQAEEKIEIAGPLLSKYAQIVYGMDRRDAERIMGGRGELVSTPDNAGPDWPAGREMMRWNVEWKDTRVATSFPTVIPMSVYIAFQNGKVTFKSQSASDEETLDITLENWRFDLSMGKRKLFYIKWVQIEDESGVHSDMAKAMKKALCQENGVTHEQGLQICGEATEKNWPLPSR